jgi:hypothetical protein
MGSGDFEPLESRPYPGRDVTVIDLAPGNELGRKNMNIGLVGPMSNYAAPPQLVEDVPYRDLGEMNVFARRWRGEHRGKWLTVPKLSGFCLLMTRAVYQAVGGLDTAFGLGFFDDDDLALRARRAGFELAVARDLFVHHFGSRTFAGNGVDAEKLLDENAAKFAAKWGLTAPLGKRVALRPFSAHPKTNANGNGRGQSTAAELDAHDRAGLKCDEPSETFIPLTSHYPIPLRHFIGVAPRTGNASPLDSSSVGATWPRWPENAATTPKPSGCGERCSPNAPAIGRHSAS